MEVKNIIVNSIPVKIEIEENNIFLTITVFLDKDKFARFICFKNNTHIVDYQVIDEEKLKSIGKNIYEEMAEVLWEKYYLTQYSHIIEKLDFTNKQNIMCKIELLQRELKK
jgi:hypothetical protein